MATKKKVLPYVKLSTPVVVVDAKELVKGDVIRTRSGDALRLTAARKRDGVVRVQFDGKQGVFPLPRTAPVERYAIEVAA